MNLRMTLALTAGCSFPTGVLADETDAKLLKSFVSSQTAAVAMLDLSAADVPVSVEAAQRFAPDRQAAESVKVVFEKLRASHCKRLYLVVTPQGLLPNEWAFLLAAAAPEHAPEIRAAFPSVPGMTVADKDGGVFFGSAAAWDQVRHASAGDAENLLRWVERAKPMPIAVIARLPEAHRMAIAELAPLLPSSLGGGPTAPLIDGFDALELSATAGARPSISIIVHARNAAAAKRIESLAAKGLSLAEKAPSRAMPAEKAIRSLVAELKPVVAENRVELSIDLANAKVQGALRGLAEAAGESARRHKVVNDLKQIALAMHSYHDNYKSFPPGATVDRNGKPLLSWRVHILPYLDQNELYKKFKLDEPWDSEHNRTLVDQMPEIYAAFRSSLKDGKTSILGIAGPGGLFPKLGEAVRINDIKDGTSNTFMCIAAPASQAVVWTKPDDLSIADAGLLSKVGAPEILAAFCDGSVQSIPVPAKLEGLLSYLTINGREVIGQ